MLKRRLDLPLQDITQAFEFVGNVLELLGIHGKVNYIFDFKSVPKYFLIVLFFVFLMAYAKVLTDVQFGK